jgi:hypothetical protein
MMNREFVPWMLRGSAATSLSNRTDLSVPGVLTASGVEAKEKVEDSGDKDSGMNEAAMTSAMKTMKDKEASVGVGNHPRSCAPKFLINVTAIDGSTAHVQLGRTVRRVFPSLPLDVVYTSWHDPAASSRLTQNPRLVKSNTLEYTHPSLIIPVQFAWHRTQLQTPKLTLLHPP